VDVDGDMSGGNAESVGVLDGLGVDDVLLDDILGDGGSGLKSVCDGEVMLMFDVLIGVDREIESSEVDKLRME
jgi:hypothetical protein